MDDCLTRLTGISRHCTSCLTHLAASHQESGNAQAAAQCWEQSLAILTELNHPDAAEVLARLRRLDTANAS